MIGICDSNPEYFHLEPPQDLLTIQYISISLTGDHPSTFLWNLHLSHGWAVTLSTVRAAKIFLAQDLRFPQGLLVLQFGDSHLASSSDT
jgi:hypothetical protein